MLGLPLNVHNAAGQSTLFEQPSRSNRYKLNDQTWDLIKDSVGAIDDKLTFTVDEGKPVSYTRREVMPYTSGHPCRAWLQGRTSGCSRLHVRLVVVVARTRSRAFARDLTVKLY